MWIGGSSIDWVVWDAGVLSGGVVGGVCGGTARISCLLRRRCPVGAWTT